MHESLLKGAQVMSYITTLILGISLTCLGLSIQSQMCNTSKCPESVKKANTGVLVLGVVLITSTIFMLWSKFAHKGLGSSNITKFHLNGYLCFTLFISIILTTLGAVMRDNLKYTKVTTYDQFVHCKEIKSKVTIIMTIGICGILLTLTPLIMLGIHHTKNKYQKYSSVKRDDYDNDNTSGM